MAQFTVEDVERFIQESLPLELPCGCTISFRGTVEKPVADFAPCPKHLGMVNELNGGIG